MRITEPDHAEPLPDLQLFELTVAPAYFASGRPIDNRASRQVLQERCTRQVRAINAEGATALYERREDRMVTACRPTADAAMEGGAS